MQIFLKGRITYVVDIEKTDTILDIKNIIFEKERILPRHLILSTGLHCLEDNRTLEDYGIDRDSTIQFRVRAPAGPCITPEL